MDWWIYLLVVIVGFVAGFINTLAGSGSLMTLPLLIFLGLPANVANGTNRIAILLQNIVAVGSFKKEKVINYKESVWLIVPAIIGSLIGARLAININEEIMRMTIGGLLIVMFFLILYKPDKWVKGQAGLVTEKPSVLKIIIFFFIGLYGGFIQAGVGFFLLSGLVLSAGYDLVKANAYKLLIVLAYTPFALAIFIYNGQVDYKWGLILACGNMLGAFIATKFAVSWGAKYVRYVLLTILFIASLKLLGIVDFILAL
jgi:uncharacterized protein